jgi:hypothetical protein
MHKQYDLTRICNMHYPMSSNGGQHDPVARALYVGVHPMTEAVCSICRHEISDHGHNAQPITNGRCCDVCNATVVEPARQLLVMRLAEIGFYEAGTANEGNRN